MFFADLVVVFAAGFALAFAAAAAALASAASLVPVPGLDIAIDIAAVNLGTGTANISGCTFTGNHANTAGGGALVNESTQMNVTNCTFINNTAKFGGVARNGGGTGTNINFSHPYSAIEFIVSTFEQPVLDCDVSIRPIN